MISRFPMETSLDVDFADEWTAIYGRGCPSRSVVELLANKWSLYVLGALRRSPRPIRFNEFRRLLDGVSQKVLTQTLRRLERDGLVRRSVYATVPPKVDYALTELGVTAAELAAAIGEWAVDHVPAIDAARADFDRKSDAELEPIN